MNSYANVAQFQTPENSAILSGLSIGTINHSSFMNLYKEGTS